MERISRGLALALATFSTSSFALGTAEQPAACTPDAFRLCGSEIPNVERVIACQAVMNMPISNAARTP
jgi:hypothetical protein